MANEIHANVVFESASGLARDRTVNTFNVRGTAALAPADLDFICDALITFYNGTYAGNIVGSFIDDSVSRGVSAHTVNLYDVSAALDGSGAGSPVHSKAWTLTPADDAVPLPRECAYVLSYVAADLLTVPEEGPFDPAAPVPKRAQHYGAPATANLVTKPRARKRGRIYIGPLSSRAVDSSGGTADVDAQVATGLRNAARAAFIDLKVSLASHTPAIAICVWSRRNAAFDALSSIPGDVIGFDDNAFDTQRKRGWRPTNRAQMLVP